MSAASCPTPPRSPIFFLHMPKAAGSTLANVIKRVYRDGTIRSVHGSPETIAAFFAEPDSERHAIDVLTGHLRYELIHALRQPATLVTMLRDPVERTLSLYHYIRRDPNHRLYEKVTQMPLEDFIEFTWAPEADNDHVRRLNDAPQATVKVGAVTQAMLDTALQRLYHPNVLYGLAERFEDSLALFSRRLNWPAAPYDKVNVTPNRPAADTVDPATLDRIRHLNRFDLELYRHAAKAFDRRLADAAEST